MKWMAALALAGCAPAVPKIAITGDELLRHQAELANNDQADVATRRIGNGAERSEAHELVFFYQTVTVNGETTTLQRVLAGCPGAHCGVTAKTRIVIRDVPDAVLAEERAASGAGPDGDPGPHTNAYNPERAHVAGAFTLLGLGVGAVCAFECGDAREPALITIGISTLVLATAWAVFSGARD
ncbi:MAG: hypothetical protein QM831_16425 [Kofleriaceae bacterium]